MASNIDDPAALLVERCFNYPEPAAGAYVSNTPFPHAVLSGGWNPDLITACKREIAGMARWDGEKDFFGARKKRFCANLDVLPQAVTRVIREANSPAFLCWLTLLTGEKALLPDPYLTGGGVHQISAGGFLKVHADFNWNEQIQLYRRLNLLLYLNPDWDSAWGGALELWNGDMTACAATVQPQANTMVVFTTDDRSFHGHPRPLACPVDITRDSIALYYYSSIRPTSNFDARRVGTDYRPVDGDMFPVTKPRPATGA